MKSNLFSAIMVGLFAAMVFASCADDNPADNPNPYKISMKTDAKAENDGCYLVDANGGTFTFDFYSGEPWLYSITETVNGKSVLNKAEFRSTDEMKTSWTSVSIVKNEGINKRLIVTILPSDATEYRYINILVANSMQRMAVHFKQQSKNGVDK